MRKAKAEKMNAFIEYIDTISNGLKKTIATDSQSNVIDTEKALFQWADKTYEVNSKSGLLFFCGNGASATMAEHLADDCLHNAGMKTETSCSTAHLTAIANDNSSEELFSFRIGRFLGKNDLLITISSSGNSPDILKAIETAREKGSFIVTLSGRNSDNKSRKMGDLNFYVPLPTYGETESAHAALLHCWLDLYMDKYLGGRH